MRYPKYLKPNDTIGFIAPSFGCAGLEPYHSRFLSALDFFKEKGFSAKIGQNVYRDDGIGKSTSPDKCGKEINEFFPDRECGALISVGGGETMCEDLDFVDFDLLASSEPKWFLGYSDNTNLTFTLPTLCDTAAIYGPCASSFGMRPVHPYLLDALDLLCGKKKKFKNYDFWEIENKSSEELPLTSLNATEPFSMYVYNPGHSPNPVEMKQDENVALLAAGNTASEICNIEFSGRLLGGCLDLLTILCGTKYDKVKEFSKKYADDGIIWFLEACDLNPLSVLRSLWQLKNAGWFESAKGFLIGRSLHFSENTFGIGCRDAYLRILKEFNVPVLLDLDIGHLPPSTPIVSGALGKVRTEGNSVSIEYDIP